MNICILNGSPKAKNSVTLHTCLFLEKKFPDCAFEYVQVGQKIKSLEKDMTPALAAIERADLVVFAYPIYTFLAPYQLHRFVELLKEQNLDFSGKFATQITTSKHFYDVTAHHYIRDNCFDLGLSYITGLSADMDDLTKAKGQKEAMDFWKFVQYSVANNMAEPVPPAPQFAPVSYQRQFQPVAKSDKFPTVIVTNMEGGDQNLANMIADFQAIYPYETRVINIAQFPFQGGCLGCLRCAVTGNCIYKDGFDKFLREEIQSAPALVYAFTVKDHSMGASFKCYDDRQFCNGHRMVNIGMPLGYLVAGNYWAEDNLKMVIEGRAQVGHNRLAGVATDGKSMKNMVKNMVFALDNPFLLPQNFYGVGGTKIFRDLIYEMRGLMKADHQFYKSHGLYDDFPQKHKGRMLLMMVLGAMNANPKLQKKMAGKMNEGIIGPYRKVVDEA